ncbi:hypothetical protein DESAMIL20_635 [Desulfurella amilsii]|uniref:Uncharacterized protein n=1 Tax=Desulfurella amilsii TaxID=1562698 RepID=A0A1X4XYA7_9BACT|nr:PH domain-containing protein [Desulfurella amilsii]OSS42520.1 hypothetical protein DESAMIL20_635 [Desulfurella amilsii]
MPEVSLEQKENLLALVNKAQEIKKQIESYGNVLDTDNNLCPVCRKGFLKETKSESFFSKIYTYQNCKAEFRKGILNKFQLIKAYDDPYGVYQKFNQYKFTLSEWKALTVDYYKKGVYPLNKKFEEIKDAIKKEILQQFINGNLKLNFINTDKFVLQPDEFIYFNSVATKLEFQKHKTVHKQAQTPRKYSGFSIRIAKGITYYTGSSRSSQKPETFVEEYTSLDEKDRGDFVITNQKIFFSSPVKNIAIPFKKITAIDFDEGENALSITHQLKAPSIFRISKTFNINLNGLELEITLSNKDIADVIKFFIEKE